MEAEIADQTFSFPSLELARMLSPKSPKPGVETAGELRLLHQYNCTVDKKPFQDALDDAVKQLRTFTPQPAKSSESASYPGLVKFLTECVEACHNALDKQRDLPVRQNRWYERLEFIVARNVMDRVDHASSLKPDIAGGKGISALSEDRLFWKPPPEKPTHRITLPVEVKNRWRDMVSQAATYARCLFSASPMRTFALVLAFNQEKNALRFLVFHHGGLTASEEYDITKRDGLKEVARLFLTLASWETAEDAGVITCYNDTTYLLPEDQDGTSHVVAEVEDILSWYLCIRGRMTFVSRLRLQTGVHPAAPESLKRVPGSLVELGTLPLRRSARLIKKVSTRSDPVGGGPTQHTGGSRGRGSRSLPPVKPMATHIEKGEPGTGRRIPTIPERTDGLFFLPE